MKPAPVTLPALLAGDLRADRCREAAAAQGLQPAAVEKDYFLTRLIWGLAQVLGPQTLLKGGTLLSKVDLGFARMSEDVDLVVPGAPAPRKRANALLMDAVRSALLGVSADVGVDVPFPHGDRSERDSHVQWEFRYPSDFGPQRIIVEATIRPVLLPPRRVGLKQLLPDSSWPAPWCWALDGVEARAEKVRAAFTRRAIRDYFDLHLLAQADADFTSPRFVDLVDRKLAELRALPLSRQPPQFGMTENELAALAHEGRDELSSVLRVDAEPFDLEAMVARFDEIWGKRRMG
jgi:predicted nucleotidyltransferase component of viral defense system